MTRTTIFFHWKSKEEASTALEKERFVKYDRVCGRRVLKKNEGLDNECESEGDGCRMEDWNYFFDSPSRLAEKIRTERKKLSGLAFT